MAKIVEVLVRGRPIDVYSHNGRKYIEGRNGSDYSLRITNPHWQRVKAVVSVDGISVIDGKLASSSSQGYLIPAYGSIDIDGWRISNDAVRAFMFGDLDGSYSNKSGNGTANTGVIAVRLFHEKLKVTGTIGYNPQWTWERRYATPNWTTLNTVGMNVGNQSSALGQTYDTYQGSFYSSAMSEAAFTSDTAYGTTSDTRLMSDNTSRGVSVNTTPLRSNLATGQGEAVESKVNTVEFDASTTHSNEDILYYDSRQGLIDRGVIRTRKTHVPNPFPGDGFCKSF